MPVQQSSPAPPLPHSSIIRPLHIVQNEVDPQFRRDLLPQQRQPLIGAHLNLSLLFNACVVWSDSNALHSEFSATLFANQESLRLLKPDQTLSEFAPEGDSVSPLALALRDSCRSFSELDAIDIKARGGRILGVTAMDSDLPALLDKHGSAALIRYSAVGVAQTFTEYCRAPLTDEKGTGYRAISAIDADAAVHMRDDFLQQTANGGAYKHAPTFEDFKKRPKADALLRAYLDEVKPGYQRGVPRELLCPLTVAYRRPAAVETTVTLAPVSPPYATEDIVLTDWGMETLACLSLEQILTIRGTKECLTFLRAKKYYMERVLTITDIDADFRNMMNATKVYCKQLDGLIRKAAGLAPRSSGRKYALLVSKFTHQLSPVTRIQGIWVLLLGAATVLEANDARSALNDGDFQGAAEKLLIVAGGIGAMALSGRPLMTTPLSMVFGLSSAEKKEIQEAASELWYYRPTQVESCFLL